MISSSDGGDPYRGLDRFGRVAEQRWRTGAADTDRFGYGHDRDSNRLTKTLPLQPSKNETYGYGEIKGEEIKGERGRGRMPLS